MVNINEAILGIRSRSFNIVYADPPWSYKQQVKSGVLTKRDGSRHYESMSQSELCDLGQQVMRICKEDAALFLWATMPLLQEALDVIKSWGFIHKTTFVTWVKTTKDGSRPAFGVGYYSRSNAELCLLATRGKIASFKKSLKSEGNRGQNSMNQIVMSPRRQHSRKPEVVRDMIVKMFGNLPRIELFARQTSPGWSVLGNEINLFSSYEQNKISYKKHKRAYNKNNTRKY